MWWPFGRSKKREADIKDELAFDMAADPHERGRSGTPKAEAERISKKGILGIYSVLRRRARRVTATKAGLGTKRGLRQPISRFRIVVFDSVRARNSQARPSSHREQTLILTVLAVLLIARQKA
jgi:hypothetical protein